MALARTDQKAAAQVISDLTANGGGTYERGTLLPFRPDHGYAVGIGGVHLPLWAIDEVNVLRAARMATTEYESAFVGTWLKDGVVYFDAVTYFGDRLSAVASGRFYCQEAIYDFGSKEAIAL